MFEEAKEVVADAPDEFSDEGRGGCLDLEGVVDGTGEIFLADSEFSFGFFLCWEVLLQEIDEFLGSFAC